MAASISFETWQIELFIQAQSGANYLRTLIERDPHCTLARKSIGSFFVSQLDF